MALPASGPLAISDIATEFPDTAPNSLSEFYRGGGLVPDSPTNSSIPTSGQIAVGNFYGATNVNELNLAITANTQNYDVFTQASADPGYAAGGTDVIVTISPGVFVGSASTGSYALSVPSSFTAGDSVTIVNNGVVIGRGGNGGSSPISTAPGGAGGTGGNAVYVNFPTTITNNGTLAGGGGGGGSGGSRPLINSGGPDDPETISLGGGGGGGGAGSPGGSGGPGTAANAATKTPRPGSSGASGNTSSGGGGGAGGSDLSSAGPGGPGGGRGANGSSGTPSGPVGAGGGGGTRGFYLVGNPLVTFPATGTRQGQVS